MKPLGNGWLRERYGIRTGPLSHISYLGTRLTRATDGATITETYPSTYDPGEDPMDHVEFALKYDDIHLDLLRNAFSKIGRGKVAGHVARRPTGKYSRRIGFLYELVMGERLHSAAQSGNYVPLLDAARYVTAAPRRIPRWRIEDNLLGTAAYCPIVRRTQRIAGHLSADWPAKLQTTLASTPPHILGRVLAYLYLHETKSSFDIEHEAVSPQRSARFVKALRAAGRDPGERALGEERLTRLQNLIVDPRYAERGFRTRQNYLGPSEFGERPEVSYIPPPPSQMRPLMEGLSALEWKSRGAPPAVRAAVAAFGFVFIHPFMDGNGRIHRFLLHDFLTRDGYIADHLVLPLSAVMLDDIASYVRVLEAYSEPIATIARFELDAKNRLTLSNPGELEGYYRYPDLTAQVEFVARIIERSIERSVPDELDFLTRFDRARSAVRSIVDMPNRKLDALIHILRQNNGRMSQRKRKAYGEITDRELARIESAFRHEFGKS